ncbi:MAG TPA: transporter [Xanthobacteraceae bacterium]
MSFWLPGLFGSLAATPLQPGLTLSTTYYHTSVSASGDVALAREFETRRVPVGLAATLSGSVSANIDLALVNAIYTFPTPVLGGQANISLLSIYGRSNTSLDATLSGVLTVGPFQFPFLRSDSFSDTVWGFGDLYPMLSLRWNSGVSNWMVYLTGDIPVGTYSDTSLANIGIGHGAIDAGYGYTYFNPQTGHEFSAVLGITYNFTNQSTQYQNGVDMHLDWGASQFLSKQFLVGIVGYVYKEVGCDSGSGDRLGCFQSQVVGLGPQIGFIFPVGNLQGYLNLKGYREFAAADRPDGWNVWASFVISPAPPMSSAPPSHRMITK